VAASADEILGGDMIEFSTCPSGVEIALFRHFIIHHWHTSHYGAFCRHARVRPPLND